MSLENKGTITNRILVTSEPDRSGNLICDGTADEVQINLAFTYLTSGRTGKETVKLIGDFTIAAPITIPNYTTLDMSEARIFLTANSDCDMIQNSDTATGTQIELIGGILDANKANQGPGFWNGVFFDHVTYGLISGVYLEETKGRGFYLTYFNYSTMIACDIYNTDNDGILWLYNELSECVGNHVYTSGTDGIEIQGGHYNAFASNTVHQCAAAGFKLQNCPETQFVGNHVHNVAIGFNFVASSANNLAGNDVEGTDPTGAYYLDADSHHNTIVSSWIQGTDSPAVSVLGDENLFNSIWVHGTEDAWIYTIGFDVDGDRNIFNDCYVYDTSGDGFNISGDQNIVSNCATEDCGGDGIEINGGNDNSITGNLLVNSGAYGINIDADADDNLILGNKTLTNASGGINIGNANCSGNVIKENRMGEATKMVDGGTNTIYAVMTFQFTEPIGTATIVVASPTGIDVDADTEGALAWGQILHEVQQVIRLKIWAVALDAPMGAGGQMHLELTFNAGASNAAYNEAGKSWALANFDGEEADYVANDVVHWVIENGDVGNELSNLVAGDSFELLVMHEASADPDGATDALFRVVEVEYV